MRIVIQRVSSASVSVSGQIISSIGNGLVVLLGIEDTDTQKEADWLVQKLINMRLFADEEGKMNKSVMDSNGEVLLISQFTLFADIKKGNRPSYLRAARPEKAIPLYEYFIGKLNERVGKPCKTGVFGANMQVGLVNDGPVTIVADSESE